MAMMSAPNRPKKADDVCLMAYAKRTYYYENSFLQTHCNLPPTFKK